MNIMNLEEYKGVYVFAEQVDNKLSGIAFELLGKAKDLAADLNAEVAAVLIGSDVKGLADELAAYGADKVIVVDDPELKEYRTEPYAHALASVINKYKPEIMLVGATAIGRDLGPRVSARVKTGLTADCTQLEIGDFPINPVAGKEQLRLWKLLNPCLRRLISWKPRFLYLVDVASEVQKTSRSWKTLQKHSAEK